MIVRLLIVGVTMLLAVIACAASSPRADWTPAELEELQSMTLSALEPMPADPTNRVADDERAAALGRQLFFDPRLSANVRVSCGTCHQPERGFQDGLPLAHGVGETTRRTMPIAGMGRAPFLFWDGRKDSLWAQALGPLESAVEHGGTRAQYAHVIAEHYAREYEAIFGPLPDLAGVPVAAGPVADARAAEAWRAMSDGRREDVTRVFVNAGKAIAAFERQIEPVSSRFDEYVAALTNERGQGGRVGDEGRERGGRPSADVLNAAEIAGLRLFIGKASCTRCHNGPLLTNNEFHNTGVPAVAGLPADSGRRAGRAAVLADEFNCRSRWSDAPNRCAELDFMVSDDHVLERAFKVPSLRDVAARAPYMHAGQIATLADVIDHYNRAPAAPRGHSELEPLRLTMKERRQIEAFLRTLSGGARAAGRGPLEYGRATQDARAGATRLSAGGAR